VPDGIPILVGHDQVASGGDTQMIVGEATAIAASAARPQLRPIHLVVDFQLAVAGNFRLESLIRRGEIVESLEDDIRSRCDCAYGSLIALSRTEHTIASPPLPTPVNVPVALDLNRTILTGIKQSDSKKQVRDMTWRTEPATREGTNVIVN
jgi:hypothetical protein